METLLLYVIGGAAAFYLGLCLMKALRGLRRAGADNSPGCGRCGCAKKTGTPGPGAS